MIDRITILGGSSVYIPEFVLAAISHNLNVKEIVLFGRPGKKLGLVAEFSERLLRKSGYPAKITPLTDLREAARGAKYIINHIRVGGMQARMRDEMIPPRLGMVGDESIGPGAFANAMRTLPIVLEHAEAIESVNPHARYINLTNPMGIVVEGLLKFSTLDVVGACDLPGSYTKKVAHLLQEEPDDVIVDFVGISNLGWIQDVRVEDRSQMGHLLELLEDQQEDGFDHELIELFHMIPTRNTGTYFHRERIVKSQQSCACFRSELLHEAELQILHQYEDKHLCELPELTRQRNAMWYTTTIVPLVLALEGRREKRVILCMRNGDSIRDLPENASVEIPALVNRKSIRPQKVGSLPKFVKGMYLAAKESERLTVEAIRHHSYEYALQALAINPFVPSVDAAKKFLDLVIKEERLELH